MKGDSNTPKDQENADGLQAEFMQLWGKLVAQSWDDQTLRQRLLTDPAGVLKEHGADFPEDVTVKAVEEIDNAIYLPLPPRPESNELPDEELDQVAGGRDVGPVNFSFLRGRRPTFTFRGSRIGGTRIVIMTPPNLG